MLADTVRAIREGSQGRLILCSPLCACPLDASSLQGASACFNTSCGAGCCIGMLGRLVVSRQSVPSRPLMVAGYEPQCSGSNEATAGQSAGHGQVHMAQTEVRSFPKLDCLHRIHRAGEMQTRSDSTASETRVMPSSCVQDSERCPLVPQSTPVSAEFRKRTLVGSW